MRKRAREARKEKEERSRKAARGRGHGPQLTTLIRLAAEGQPVMENRFRVHHWVNPEANSIRVEQFLAVVKRFRRTKLVEDRQSVYRLWLLTGLQWVRPLETYKARGRAAETRFRSLVDHLVCEYPVPPILYSLLDVEMDRRGLVKRVGMNPYRRIALFQHLATGGSLRKAVKSGALPVALTKKQCALFLQAPEHLTMFEAVRWAQVRAEGGTPGLFEAFSKTRLGRRLLKPEEEAFWRTVIHWFSRQGMVAQGTVGPLVDYIRHCREEEGTFTMAGRAFPALVRSMEEWHRELGRLETFEGVPARFAPSGLEPGQFTTKARMEHGQPLTQTWRVTEILTMADLVEESRTMNHCVSSYWPSMKNGGYSVWSLTCDGGRRVTVAVLNRERRVSESCRRFNKAPLPEERDVIIRWAMSNGLSMERAIWGWNSW